MIDNLTLGKIMYTAYCEGVGGVAFNGDALPDAETFFADTTKEKQIKGWLASAEKVLSILVY